MAKTKISEFSPTPGNNTDIDNINIAEGCAPSGINDAIRELMAQLKDFQAGTAGDSFNGPIGSTTAVTGAFTNITASGTLGVTGVATLGNGAVLGTPTSVTLTNGTGLPIATGVSGLGTGVATALAVNVGSAGAPVLFNGALGTPASGTVTNLTGTASININGTVGATTANTGAFTTLSASSTVTLSGGTANGVAFLNASKELTTGSALTFDGTNVRLGTTSSTNKLLIDTAVSNSGNIQLPRGGFIGFSNAADSGNSEYLFANSGSFEFGVDGATRYSIGSTGVSIWSVAGSEQMRLTDTGLGIGTTTPRAKLDVGTNTGGSTTTDLHIGYSGLNYYGYRIINTVNPSNEGSGVFTIQGGTSAAWADRLTISDSGNLGLGVTPSANSLSKGFDLVGGAGLFGYAASSYLTTNTYFDGAFKYKGNAPASYYSQGSGSHQWHTAPSGTAGDAISFSQSMTLDSSGNLAVGTTSASERFVVSNAYRDVTSAEFTQILRSTSAALTGIGPSLGFEGAFNGSSITSFSGLLGAKENSTAGNSAGYLAFLTRANGAAMLEKARIDSSGNLLVGTTSANPAGTNSKIVNEFSGSAVWGMTFNNTLATGATYYSHIAFATQGTAVGYINANNTSTQYATSSDYRLKNITGPITTSGAYIDSLNPVEGTWKADGSTFVGLIAHEVQEASRTTVATGVKDGEQMQGMDYSSAEIIANLIAEVKALRTRVAALESI